ncbi:MAG: hypothetical protein IKP73_11770 [Bacteroidales bacterium]|nr:hypothetical protein [Bacteroidales bacterium]
MKRKIYLTLSFLMIFSLLLSSCKKDDENEEKFSVNGKVYAAYGYQGGGVSSGGYSLPSYDAYWVIRFTSETKFERTARKSSPTGGIIGDIETGTYTLDYPNLKLTFDEATYGDKVIEATFVSESSFRTTTGSRTLEFNLQ